MTKNGKIALSAIALVGVAGYVFYRRYTVPKEVALLQAYIDKSPSQNDINAGAETGIKAVQTAVLGDPKLLVVYDTNGKPVYNTTAANNTPAAKAYIKKYGTSLYGATVMAIVKKLYDALSPTFSTDDKSVWAALKQVKNKNTAAQVNNLYKTYKENYSGLNLMDTMKKISKFNSNSFAPLSDINQTTTNSILSYISPALVMASDGTSWSPEFNTWINSLK